MDLNKGTTYPSYSLNIEGLLLAGRLAAGELLGLLEGGEESEEDVERLHPGLVHRNV